MKTLKITLVCLLALLVAPAAAYAQTSGNPMSPLVGVTCNGSSCKGVPNDSTHWFYGFDPTVNASVQQLLAVLGQPLTINLPSGIATSALQTAGNASLVTIATASGFQATAANQTTGNGSLATIATNSGTQATAANQTNVQSTPGTPQTKAVTVQGNAAGVPVTVSGSSSTDGSTTQTAGGTAQVLFGGTTPSNGWKISVPVAIASITTFACYASDSTTTPSATTAGSQMVYAGGQYSTEPGQKPVGPVYINCPTTGQAISAQRW